MSRLDSFLRRLESQRVHLDATRALVRATPGPILELGLGNGRTMDHLRKLFPDRRVYAFERRPAANARNLPEPGCLIVGDLRRTLPAAAGWLPAPAALVHNDTGTGDAARNRTFAAWLARSLPPLVLPGGIVLSDQPLDDPALVRQGTPDALPGGRYFLYRRRGMVPA